MYCWLEILLETGKIQLKRLTRVDQDMRLKFDWLKESKCYAFSKWSFKFSIIHFPLNLEQFILVAFGIYIFMFEKHVI